eukprot:TRINITY_DN12572_c4_g6_i2.p1 TRINITY_DN12572_c4_g6~~TRINITY_DN12572_c4_g6_i2.p1  ORF type:complete len:265 (+),score=64.08 TRINITY_DN12572_c4_g6_i2:117-911(+)
MSQQELLVPHLQAQTSEPRITADHVENCWWFHREATRNAIHQLLAGQPVGAFAVRGSASRPGCFVLTASIDPSQGLVYEWLIEALPQGYRLEKGVNVFPNVYDLIAYYSTMPTGVASLGMQLRPDLWPEAGMVIRPVVLPVEELPFEQQQQPHHQQQQQQQQQQQDDEDRDIDIVTVEQTTGPTSWTERVVERQLVFDIVPLEPGDATSFDESRRMHSQADVTGDVSLGALRHGELYADDTSEDSSQHEHREYVHAHYRVRKVR